METNASEAKYRLILISNPSCNERWDFELVARYVREGSPEVHATVLDDRTVDWSAPAAELDRPTLTFSPAPLRAFRPPRGPVFQGLPLSKHEEYAALDRAGVPVPRWALLTRTSAPDLSAFGPYVVVKPDRGGRGADVKIKRKGRVRWSRPKTTLAAAAGRAECDWIVQEFVYSGPHPVSYRVASLFGEPLWSWKVEADPARRALENRHDFRGGEDGGGMSIVSSGRGCRFSLVRDEEVWALARLAHRAFPDIGLIGVDILRDADTGQLFVIEVNAIGLTWHLSSSVGRRIQQDFGFDLDAHFDARRRAARILADEVRRRAL